MTGVYQDETGAMIEMILQKSKVQMKSTVKLSMIETT
jgi:hypothetical protein